PFIVISLVKQAWGSALLFFCLAGISDLLDGFIARLLNEPTWLGSVLDPVADKFLVICSMYSFFWSSPNVLLPAWFVWVIAVRETLLLGGGCWLFFSQRSLQVKPSWLGKLTTFLILVLMILVLICAAFHCHFLEWLIHILVYTVLVCAIVSFVQYSYQSFFKN
ncbi:CDP-alcohol phosphatidyltransferase family protein, partial [Candidatus Dependentiae bacterium]|nr:CDP-alcohol phosphatidyltransferase family protein [Candidatus Dependentiae bacterium]